MPKTPSYPRSRYAKYRAPVVDRVNLMVFLRRSLRMFRSRWWIALLTTAIGSGTSIYLATTQPDIYRATSVLGIAPRVAFAQRGTDRATVLEEKNNFVQDQLSYMRGSQVLGKVEEKMQDFRLPDNSVPSKTLSAGPGAGSTFVMTVDSPNLEYARRFARTWASEFLAYKEELRSGVARRRMDKTRTDLSRQEEQVAEARQRLDDYLQEHQIATSQDTGNAAQQALVSLQQRRLSVMLERQGLEMKSAEAIADEKSTPVLVSSAGGAGGTADRGSITAPDLSAPPKDTADPFEKFGSASSYRSLKLRLRAIDAELRKQSEFLKPKHPYMERLAETRADVEREIGDQLALIEEMRKDQIESLKQEEGVLDRQVETQRAEVVRLRDINREYQRRSDDFAGQAKLLATLSSELQALTQIQSEDEDIKILEEGSASDKPIGPKRRSMIVSGVALGLLLGVGLIFLLHRLDDRIDSAEDLEKALDEPILGQLPFVARREAKEGLVSIDKLETNNIFVEALRGVRSSIMFGDLGGEKQVLMATSSVPGDGKSTFTVNFAITLANAGNRVLLIDADLRRGTVAGYFGVPSSPGLSEILSGQEAWPDVLCGTSHKTLLVIPAGKSVTNPGELLLSKNIKKLIESVRGEFDYVIFDSPPVIGMDDAASLASNCDGLVFVYRVGITSLKLAKLAVNTVRQRGGRILGLILNGVSSSNPDYYYTAYYYSHYTYGRAALPGEQGAEGGEGRPQRPRGARLLQALREADSAGVSGGDRSRPDAGSMLLADEPGPVDVQATPAPPPSDSGRPGATP